MTKYQKLNLYNTRKRVLTYKRCNYVFLIFVGFIGRFLLNQLIEYRVGYTTL